MMQFKKIIEDHILHIIQNEAIEEQSDLQKSLKNRGYDIPQATLSRKLKKLNIAKIDGTYRIINLDIPSLPVVLNMKVSDFGLIVLQTHPGNANSLAYFIDQKYVRYGKDNAVDDSIILGTIAGDDTLVLIVKNEASLKEAQKIIKGLFPYL